MTERRTGFDTEHGARAKDLSPALRQAWRRRSAADLADPRKVKPRSARVTRLRRGLCAFLAAGFNPRRRETRGFRIRATRHINRIPAYAATFVPSYLVPPSLRPRRQRVSDALQLLAQLADASRRARSARGAGGSPRRSGRFPWRTTTVSLPGGRVTTCGVAAEAPRPLLARQRQLAREAQQHLRLRPPRARGRAPRRPPGTAPGSAPPAPRCTLGSPAPGTACPGRTAPRGQSRCAGAPRPGAGTPPWPRETSRAAWRRGPAATVRRGGRRRDPGSRGRTPRMRKAARPGTTC